MELAKAIALRHIGQEFDHRVEEPFDQYVRYYNGERAHQSLDGEPPVVHFDVRRNRTSRGSAGLLTPEPVRSQFADVPDPDGIPLAGHRYRNRGASVPASPAPTVD